VRYALIGAILLHIVVFGLVIFNFAGRDSDTPKPAVRVSVKTMSPKDYSERQAGEADGKAEKPIAPAAVNAPEATASAKKEVEQKPSPKPAEKEALLPAPPPPKSVEVAKAEPPAEKPAERPAPKPAVKKEPPPKPAAKPKPKKVEEPEPKRTEARPFDPRRIEDFVNPDRPQAREPRTSQSAMAAPPAKVYSDRPPAVLNRDPNAGAPSGDYDPSKPWRPASSLEEQAMGITGAHGAMNAGTCADAIQKRIEDNWILPIGGQAAETTIIRLRIELRRDGYLSRPPAVMDASYSAVQQAMADAALRAAESGQPYNIPPQQYEQCRDMILKFNPRDMYGR
jgi:outer membrane biosynthesis protein TonB